MRMRQLMLMCELMQKKADDFMNGCVGFFGELFM